MAHGRRRMVLRLQALPLRAPAFFPFAHRHPYLLPSPSVAPAVRGPPPSPDTDACACMQHEPSRRAPSATPASHTRSTFVACSRCRAYACLPGCIALLLEPIPCLARAFTQIAATAPRTLSHHHHHIRASAHHTPTAARSTVAASAQRAQRGLPAGSVEQCGHGLGVGDVKPVDAGLGGCWGVGQLGAVWRVEWGCGGGGGARRAAAEDSSHSRCPQRAAAR